MRIAAAFALLAIAVRAFLPSGYMFAAPSDGRFEVTICSGNGAAQSTVDLQTGALVNTAHKPESPSNGRKQGADAPCAFASMTPLAAPAVSPSWIGVELPRFRSAELIATGAAILGLVAPPPPATGPPAVH